MLRHIMTGDNWLCKFRKEYGKPDGVKLSVTFDELNRISGKHRALFSSFLGDMVREHIGLKILSWKKVGSEARNNYGMKYGTHILFLNPRYFDVDLTVRKLIEKKEIKQDEEPTRGTLWLKGRVNKDGEYQDDEIRSVGDKLKETEDKIKEGTLQVDQGTDAMTLVLGKEKGGYARGVGSGVTYKRYFDLPRSKQAADERILLLESQLDAARREREEKELLIKSMSSKMSQTEGMVTELKNQLAAQGGQLQSTPTQLTPLDVSPVEIHPINSSADEEGGTTVVGCDQNDASIRKEMQKRETVKSVGAKYTTRSIRKDSSSQDSQSKENVSVLPQNDASIQKSNGLATLEKEIETKATPPSTIQMNVENKTAPKLHTKRKNVYVSSDAMQRQAKKKSLQKSLNY
ncbi:reverse transcriptase domain-containing protein [Tanacetum coccineum]|uniref:Reverse transcriptase domain-containing protein n=1 Tax=Tanacetum coccineum TaxID=301880 RepID=A0ABQ4XJ79_9ASTR